MGKRNKHYSIIVSKSIQVIFSLWILSGIPAFALDDIDASYASYYMKRLINEARARPAEIIKKYQIDLDKARVALDADAVIFDLGTDGLPPLAWNDMLARSSENHTDDMVDRMYYSYASPEGLSYDDRISDTGYAALSTGESLGLLEFNVYTDPLEAVEKIFKNMIKDELNPEYTGQRNILNVSHTEVGITFRTAIFTVGEDQQFNAYVMTADFAKPVEPRYFIMGNFYNPDSNILTIENPDYCECADLKVVAVSDHGWLHETSLDGMHLYFNDLAGEPSVDVPVGRFAGYQIKINRPSTGLFLLQMYDQINGLILKRAGIAKSVNQLMDLPISVQ